MGAIYRDPWVHDQDVGKRGNLGPHAEISDDHYYIAVPLLQDFRLWIFDSQDGKWTSRPFSLDANPSNVPSLMFCSTSAPDGIYCHVTCKVIGLGEGGLLGFVDPWRGIVVCDVIDLRRSASCPALFRVPSATLSHPSLEGERRSTRPK
ncbi:unnamed protein product [Urochloa humidicola]